MEIRMNQLLPLYFFVVQITFSVNAEDKEEISADLKKIKAGLTGIKKLFVEDASASSCDDLHNSGYNLDGIYQARIHGDNVDVFCEFNEVATSKNWLVFQRRSNSDLSFYQGWESYANGFGNLRKDFWLGLETLHKLTSQKSYRLRIDMVDHYDNTAYAEYRIFSVGSADQHYKLTADDYSGTAGDSLLYHNGQFFSTYDYDNDKWSGNCAVARKGGFWYNACCYANLNGFYYTDGREDFTAVLWYKWKNRADSLKYVEMKMRPN